MSARKVVDDLMAAGDLIAAEGFSGLTMRDFGAATGRSTTSLYGRYGDAVDILVAAVDLLLVLPWEEPLVPAGVRSTIHDLSSMVAVRHRRWHVFETVARGVALAGMPRVRMAVARLDLARFLALIDVPGLWLDEPERVQLVQPMLEAGIYRHLVGRCGWTEVQYAEWLERELISIRAWKGRVLRPPGDLWMPSESAERDASEDAAVRRRLIDAWLSSRSPDSRGQRAG